MPSNNVTRKWRKIEEKRSADDKYTLGTHMRYVYAFSNITEYSESVGSPTRHSGLNLGVHPVTSFLHFPRKKAGWHKAPSPFQNVASGEFKNICIVRSLSFAGCHVLSGLRYPTPPGLFATGWRLKYSSLESIIYINHANFWTNDAFERFENFHHNRILEQRW